jgi:TolB-like protein
MSGEIKKEIQLKIGHVLFMDIPGYSKLLINEQTDLQQQLNDIVRKTEQFRAAKKAGKLIRLPTGDGMALVFSNTAEAPVQCAMEISQALCDHPKLRLRMGIHSGPVTKIQDVNYRSNLAGAGVNLAQRVMDCGDAGHILLSKRAAEDLEQYSKWQPCLHHLGEFDVKHGVKIDIFNLYTDEVGNPALPEKLKNKKIEPTGPLARFTKPVIASVLSIAIAAAGVWFFSHRTQDLPLALVFPGKSVAIMPFRPLVAGSGDEILEAGMADMLITKLSNTREIFIPSLSAVRKYDEQKQDPVTIGRALHVNSVLEGNVQKSGDRIRVSARLIKTADGSSLWAGSFNEKFTDVFEVQDTIAQKVVDALALPLSQEQQKTLTKRYTDNTEAYQLYIKGRFYWNKYTEEGLRKSIEYFKQAVEKDRNYALAYSGMADSYSLLGDLSFAPPQEDFEQARGYAEKALALDETLASAHLSLGIVNLFYDWDFTEAEKQLRRAKDLDPNNPQIYHFYGHYLELVGRADEAVQETKRGAQLDPTNLIVNSEVGYGYYLARQPNLAIDQMRKTLDLDPTFSYASYVMASALEHAKNYRAAVTELNRVRPISGDWSWIVGELGYVYALLGNRAESEKIINELHGRETREYIDPVLVAYIYIALGDKDRAFASLDKAYQERSGLICFLQIEPKFDPLRSDPRFQDLERRMGLVPLTTTSTQNR